MAKYMLLIYGDAAQWEAMTPEQAKAHDAAHAAFNAAAGSRIVGGEELELAPMATTLRSDSAGGFVTTDGPFLETKEAVGGFYLTRRPTISTRPSRSRRSCPRYTPATAVSRSARWSITDERGGRRGARRGAPPRLVPGAGQLRPS